MAEHGSIEIIPLQENSKVCDNKYIILIKKKIDFFEFINI